MRMLKRNAIYRHFKGNYYAVMGVAKIIPKSDFNDLSKVNKVMKGYHTELNAYIDIINKNGVWYVSFETIDSEERLVLYKSLYDDTGIYARPISMFLSEVDVLKYPNSNQKFRFEEC